MSSIATGFFRIEATGASGRTGSSRNGVVRGGAAGFTIGGLLRLRELSLGFSTCLIIDVADLFLSSFCGLEATTGLTTFAVFTLATFAGFTAFTLAFATGFAFTTFLATTLLLVALLFAAAFLGAGFALTGLPFTTTFLATAFFVEGLLLAAAFFTTLTTFLTAAFLFFGVAFFAVAFFAVAFLATGFFFALLAIFKSFLFQLMF
ncbi:MAG TPA: hypothetical protein DFH96_05765 [Bacteroidetes bacterium]|nr:hypothetical protein [Bacteroidota bacterium]